MLGMVRLLQLVDMDWKHFALWNGQETFERPRMECEGLRYVWYQVNKQWTKMINFNWQPDCIKKYLEDWLRTPRILYEYISREN
jgi:hypothetical protein